MLMQPRAMPVVRWHVEGTYNPSDRGNSKTGNHMVLDEPLRAGRLVRSKGDPLCAPAKKFWGLTGPVAVREDRSVSCHKCVKHGLRLGLDFGAKAALDLGHVWRAALVIESGRPTKVELQSRWFRTPPLEPPAPPSEQALLQAVQAMAPSVRSVRIDRLDPTGYNEVGGVALVESSDAGRV